MNFQDFHERTDRACDALVLAYNSSESLGGNFYIPCCSECERAFGVALRKLFGEKEGNVHWCDLVQWNTVRDLEKVEPRILRTTREVLVSDSDSASIFDMYFISDKFLNRFYYGKGTIYRFDEDKRERAVGDFEKYWDEKEKIQWKKIHEQMRAYTLEEFSKK